MAGGFNSISNSGFCRNTCWFASAIGRILAATAGFSIAGAMIGSFSHNSTAFFGPSVRAAATRSQKLLPPSPSPWNPLNPGASNTSASTRSGCNRAKSSEMRPPSDRPTRVAFGIFRWSSSAVRSSAARYGPTGSAERPNPRTSYRITRYFFASTGTWSSHIRPSSKPPWTSTTGLPAPCTS